MTPSLVMSKLCDTFTSDECVVRSDCSTFTSSVPTDPDIHTVCPKHWCDVIVPQPRVGMFHEGDELLEVNGISVSGMSAPQAMKILVSGQHSYLPYGILAATTPSTSTLSTVCNEAYHWYIYVYYTYVRMYVYTYCILWYIHV